MQRNSGRGMLGAVIMLDAAIVQYQELCSTKSARQGVKI